MSNPKFYPRWIERGDGARIIVKDHIEHSSHMGEEFDEDANPVVKEPAPMVEIPTPIAPVEPEESEFTEPFYPPVAEKLPGDGAESQGEEVAESSQSDRPDAADDAPQSSGQDGAVDRVEDGSMDVPFDLDTPIDLDPLGLFEPPSEAEVAETAAPRRRRKKTAETGA